MSTATNTTTTLPTSGVETGKPARIHATMCNVFGRWVIYDPKHGVDYDASMVPATWFGWLHYKTDKTPAEKAPVDYSWLPKHTPNSSGSSQGRDSLSGPVNPYMPYTTTKPKIEAWVPPKNN